MSIWRRSASPPNAGCGYAGESIRSEAEGAPPHSFSCAGTPAPKSPPRISNPRFSAGSGSASPRPPESAAVSLSQSWSLWERICAAAGFRSRWCLFPSFRSRRSNTARTEAAFLSGILKPISSRHFRSAIVRTAALLPLQPTIKSISLWPSSSRLLICSGRNSMDGSAGYGVRSSFRSPDGFLRPFSIRSLFVSFRKIRILLVVPDFERGPLVGLPVLMNLPGLVR